MRLATESKFYPLPLVRIPETLSCFRMASAQKRDWVRLPNRAGLAPDRQRVKTITLDEWSLEHVEPDWLLIDIEGYEIAALSGAKRLIERMAKG